MPCNHQADGYWGVYFILNEWSVFTHWPGNSGPWRWTWGECILSYLMEFSHYVKHSRRFRWDFNTFISTHCRTNGVTPSSSLGSWDRSWSAVDLNVEWSLGSLSPLTEMCLRNYFLRMEWVYELPGKVSDRFQTPMSRFSRNRQKTKAYEKPFKFSGAPLTLHGHPQSSSLSGQKLWLLIFIGDLGTV